jgi:hypothetical protein
VRGRCVCPAAYIWPSLPHSLTSGRRCVVLFWIARSGMLSLAFGSPLVPSRFPLLSLTFVALPRFKLCGGCVLRVFYLDVFKLYAQNYNCPGVSSTRQIAPSAVTRFFSNEPRVFSRLNKPSKQKSNMPIASATQLLAVGECSQSSDPELPGPASVLSLRILIDSTT